MTLAQLVILLPQQFLKIKFFDNINLLLKMVHNNPHLAVMNSIVGAFNRANGFWRKFIFVNLRDVNVKTEYLDLVNFCGFLRTKKT